MIFRNGQLPHKACARTVHCELANVWTTENKVRMAVVARTAHSIQQNESCTCNRPPTHLLCCYQAYCRVSRCQHLWDRRCPPPTAWGWLKAHSPLSQMPDDAGKRYAQFEKECLVSVRACEWFNKYLFGLDMVTDHKPLLPLLNNNDLGNVPVRCQRLLMNFNSRA